MTGTLVSVMLQHDTSMDGSGRPHLALSLSPSTSSFAVILSSDVMSYLQNSATTLEHIHNWAQPECAQPISRLKRVPALCCRGTSMAPCG